MSRFAPRFLRPLLAAACAAVLAVGGSARADESRELLNVSYDVAREFYKDVNAQFVPVVNRWLTPSAADRALARRVIQAFDEARSQSGGKRVPAAVVDGFLAEIPDYLAAHRLLARAAQFGLE